MQRTYLPLLVLAAGGAAALALPRGWAASVFNSQPIDQERFSVLAQPVGRSDWKLLVLEQIKPQPSCWERRSDGLIDPSLNRFDFSGICSRYIDSNGYSLRVADEDLASRYRLRVEQQGQEVVLLAMNPNQPAELVVGRGNLPKRDREAFVAIELEKGWELQRRAYGNQTLSHVYFANGTPLSQLIAKASRGSGGPGAFAALPGGIKPLPPQPLASGDGPIALQVIPYKP